MRFIGKKLEPEDFINWKAQANEDWTPTFSTLPNPEKGILHNSLLVEQGYICCYCGRRIERSSSHIEHLKPQHPYQNEALNYNNMMASCNGLDDNLPAGNARRSEHCGHKKDNWYDDNLMVSPLDPLCGTYFNYTSAGEVIGLNDAALETINKLELKHPGLVRSRKMALNGVIEIMDTRTVAELRLLYDRLDELDIEGKLTPFCFVAKDLLSRYITV